MAHIAFAGCKYTTRDCLQQLLRDGFTVDFLITISPEQARANQVAGYEDLSEFAVQHGIEVCVAERYDLKSAADVAMFRRLQIDALLVIGWERLIPPSVLNLLRCGAYGMHGSPRGLPFGRGRSPLNWSLICGEKSFRTSLFRYSPGVDDGAIVDTFEFEINQFDTCKTLHYKNRMAMNALLRRHLAGILEGSIQYSPQPPQRPTFYPRRRPEDGIIDWARPSSTIHNFVRALTRPYPGAFTSLGSKSVAIWACQPFGAFEPSTNAPGTILEVFGDGDFLVQTADQPLLVTDYQAEDRAAIEVGLRFVSGDWWETIRTIATRYPDGVEPDQMEITHEKLAGVFSSIREP